MATLSITVQDAIVPRLLAAYGVTTNGGLKSAIIAEIKSNVVSYEIQMARSVQRAKEVTLSETSRDAVLAAEAKATSEVTLG